MSLTFCWVSDMEGRKVSVRWILGGISQSHGWDRFGATRAGLQHFPWQFLYQCLLGLLHHISNTASCQHFNSAHLKTEFIHAHVLNVWFFSFLFKKKKQKTTLNCFLLYFCIVNGATVSLTWTQFCPCPWICLSSSHWSIPVGPFPPTALASFPFSVFSVPPVGTDTNYYFSPDR